MSKETLDQKEMREHYEKIYKDALTIGPTKNSELTDERKSFNSWMWCQIDHVCMAMGGFANFRYFVTEEGESRFKKMENLEAENKKIKELLSECTLWDTCKCDNYEDSSCMHCIAITKAKKFTSKV